MSFHKPCFAQRPYKKSIMENEIDEIAKKTYILPNVTEDYDNPKNQVKGGNIQIWRLERYIFSKYLRTFSNINKEDRGGGYWDIPNQKEFRDWGINRYDLNEYERDGYITIEKLGKGRSLYNVRIRPTNKPFPHFLDDLTEDEKR